jgi:hypothetical protein
MGWVGRLWGGLVEGPIWIYFGSDIKVQEVLNPLVADYFCCVKPGEVLGRDGDAATATALKAIQDVESEEREAARLREQKIAQKASFNEEYDTGDRSDFMRALIFMQQHSTPYLGSTLCALRFKDGVISFLVIGNICGRRDQNKHWKVLQLHLHFRMVFVLAAEV